jgi:hypothetical protein
MYQSVDGNDVTYRQSKKRGFCSRHAVAILACWGLILLITGVICAITNVFEDWVKDEIRDVSANISINIYCCTCITSCCQSVFTNLKI